MWLALKKNECQITEVKTMPYTNQNNYLSLLDPFFNMNLDEDEKTGFGSLSMKADILKNEEGYTINIDVPGVKKEDLKISYEDGYLTVEAKASTEAKEKEKFITRERFSGSCKRSFYLGDIDKDSIKASHENGVLSISFNEAKAENKVTNIAIY